MTKNLAVNRYQNGDTIFQANNASDWYWAERNQIGAWCYNTNEESNGKIYGKLYNWFAVNDPRSLAPKGWHIPSDDEWEELVDLLGENPGSKLAGEYDLWHDGVLRKNIDFGTSGFSAIPGGYDDGTVFSAVGFIAAFWTSTIDHKDYSICSVISHSNTNIQKSTDEQLKGYSVSCISD